MAFRLDYVRSRLPGRRIHHYDTIDSTMHEAEALAQAGSPSGTAVLADEQTAGLGRHGHSWHSERNAGLYCSVVLRLELPPGAVPILTLALGLAAAEAIERAAGIACDIRWPNDLMIRDRKTGGILVRLVTPQAAQPSASQSSASPVQSVQDQALQPSAHSPAQSDQPSASSASPSPAQSDQPSAFSASPSPAQSDQPSAFSASPSPAQVGQASACQASAQASQPVTVIAGIGINIGHTIFPSDLEDLATSLLLETGRAPAREDLTLELLPAVDRWSGILATHGPGVIISLFTQRSTYAEGRRVFAGDLIGTTAGLTESGFLLIDTDDGKRETILAGGVRAAGIGRG